MKLTDQDIREFIEAWEEDFNELLSTAEAQHHASQLMELYAVLSRPLPGVERPPT